MNIKVLITTIVGIICSTVPFFATASQLRKMSRRRVLGEVAIQKTELCRLTASHTSASHCVLFLTLYTVPAELSIVSDLQAQGRQMWHQFIALRCKRLVQCSGETLERRPAS